MRKYLYILVGLMIIFSLTSCKKDPIVHGELIVKFINSNEYNYEDNLELEVNIFSIHNGSYPIYKQPVNTKGMKIELNAGEYLIRLVKPSSTNVYPTEGFIVITGKTTNIYYENYGRARIEY